MIGFIPSPTTSGFHIGPFFVHIYGLIYVIAIIAAIAIVIRPWEAQGGSREVVYKVAIWAIPAGIVGARIYFVVTSWNKVPSEWWGVFAIWKGGMGVWGGIAVGAAVGL